MSNTTSYDLHRHATSSTDPRVVRTRKLISDAFLDLLDNNSLNKITVSAISAKAGINRKTFYLHFSSVEDLVEYEACCLADRIIRATQKTELETGAPDLRTIFVELTALTAERPQMYRRILNEIPLNKLVDLLANPMCERILYEAPELSAQDARSIRYLLRYYVAGTLATFMQYVAEDDTPSSSEIIEILDAADALFESQLGNTGGK